MRTRIEIEQNVRNIRYAMDILRDQIELINDDYQKNAVEVTGSECDTFTDIAESVGEAMLHLNILARMEEDLLLGD